MPALSLNTWVERVARTVEENGASARRVRLIATEDGGTIQVWEHEEYSGRSDDWCEEVDDLLNALADDWPCRLVRLQFIAEDQAGGVRATLYKSVRGRNAEAPKTQSEGLKAQTDAMASLSRTMQHTLELVNSQVTSARQVIDSQAAAFSMQTDLVIALRGELANAQAQVNRAQLTQNADQLIGGMLEQLPDLIKLWKSATRVGGGASGASAHAAPANGAS